MFKHRTIFIQTLAAFATASLMTCSFAADVFPSENMSVNNVLTFTGDENTDAIINTKTEQPNDNGGWDAANVAAGGSLTVKDYRDFRIDQPSDGVWMYGLYTPYSGTINVDVKRDIRITAQDVAVHSMQTGSNITLKAGNDVVLTATDGQAVYAQQQSQISIEAGNNITLSGTGNVVGFLGADTNTPASISLTAGNKITITAEEGKNAIGTGTWGGNPQQSGVITMGAVGGIDITGNIALNDEAGKGQLKILDGTSDIYMHGDSTTAIKEFTGTDVTFHYDRIADSGKTQTIGNITGKVSVEVGHEDLDAMSTQEATQALQDGFDFNGTATGYGTNYTVSVDADGNAVVEGSDITKMTNDLAAVNLVAWRNEITTLNDRMSSLRTNPSDIGAWARYNGGEYQYDSRDFKNQFNTIEVGVDAKVAQNWIVGASFSYTKGDGDLNLGETDSDTYSGALYALWTHEKGSFVDTVMKVGRLSTDFDFHNMQGGAYDNGSLDQTGFIFGVETGHRFALPMNTFVEPQIQLTYSRLSSVSETTQARHVKLDSTESLIGRVGVMAGMTFSDNKGSAYAKVSALKDFKGDIDGTYSAVGGTGTYRLSQDLDDSWVEYSIGANYMLTDNLVTFIDVSKSAGADIDLDWRANIGAKLFF